MSIIGDFMEQMLLCCPKMISAHFLLGNIMFLKEML